VVFTGSHLAPAALEHQKGPTRLLRIVILTCTLSLCAGTIVDNSASSAVPATFVPPDHEFVVATKQAPPFAMKGGDGGWQGISIDLWRRVAEQMHLRYRFIEVTTVQDLLDATANGTADAAVAAVTVTAARARVVDFTQPFYETGLGVAVQSGVANWLPVMRTFLSFNFLQAVLALLGIALVVGILIWLFERRQNDNFAGHPIKGLTSGIWWSAVAMTQAGAAQGGPSSLPGRLLAVVWMIVSIISLAVFTAGITSAITTHQLQGLVRNVADLHALRVGVVAGSSSVDFLEARRVAHDLFADAPTGLKALQAGHIDAFVYDRPLLTWIVQQNFSGLQVLGVTFGQQNYAIALPSNSDLRIPLDIALLESANGDWWKQTLYRYLGAAGATPGD
jgi:polar amino acid transport system substrate-binding protein